MNRSTLSAILLALVATGCTKTLSGLDAKDTFSCSAVGGVSCESMTTIYNRTQAGTLPAQKAQSAAIASAPSAFQGKESNVGASTTFNSGEPIRSQTQVARLWIAPWVDVDGDLHDASYVYFTIGTGKWLVEHTRQQIMSTYGPRRAVPKELNTPATKSEQAPLISPGGIADINKDPAAAEIIKRMMGGQQQ
jgi:conjugal transfer pilus assembly protein TraV